MGKWEKRIHAINWNKKILCSNFLCASNGIWWGLDMKAAQCWTMYGNIVFICHKNFHWEIDSELYKSRKSCSLKLSISDAYFVDENSHELTVKEQVFLILVEFDWANFKFQYLWAAVPQCSASHSLVHLCAFE